jgi:hypothetical protein
VPVAVDALGSDVDQSVLLDAVRVRHRHEKGREEAEERRSGETETERYDTMVTER